METHTMSMIKHCCNFINFKPFKMKKRIFTWMSIFMIGLNYHVFGQGSISINTDGLDPDPSAILDVISTEQGILIPRMTETQRDDISNPAEYLMIINTTTKCLEMHVSGNWVPFCPIEEECPDLNIGDLYGGGIVAATDYPGVNCGYLIVADSDQSIDANWGCVDVSVSGLEFGVGFGQANSTAILNACPTTGIAVRICDELSNDGYSDWFLPNRGDLIEIENNLVSQNIGNFADDWYWNSNQATETNAWLRNLFSGTNASTNKNNENRVRCTRAF